MAKTTKTTLSKTLAPENTFIKRYTSNDASFPKLSFSEEYFMVAQKDLVKGTKFEDCHLKPKFIGESKDIGRYVIINVNDFGKLLDNDKIRKDLVKTAQQSLREDPSSDDYFKMLYSNTLRHLSHIMTDTHFSHVNFASFARSFVIENLNFLPIEERKKIIAERCHID